MESSGSICTARSIKMVRRLSLCCRRSATFRRPYASLRTRMRADHRRLPFSISVDKHAFYPDAFACSQKEKVLPKDCRLRRTKYLTNIVEQDHRFVRRRWRSMQCFRSFHTAERTIEGIEAMHMIHKGQVKRLDRRDTMGQARFVESLFGVAA